MLKGKRILAVVPARCGSKGIPGKNMRIIAGTSLIGIAGKVLALLEWLDTRVISTDSERYADEGRHHGLDAPFLRPARLGTDSAGAVETVQHALRESESHFRTAFDIVLIIEPTSPLRHPEDVAAATELLIDSGADSVVTVSTVPTKFHPRKLLDRRDGWLSFYLAGGNEVQSRQSLDSNLCWRNGVCYAMTRECLMEKGVVFTDKTMSLAIDRPVVNIDDPFELEMARRYFKKDSILSSIVRKG